MTDIEFLTLQNAAMTLVIRALVKTHPSFDRVQDFVEANAALFLGTALAGAPEDYRAKYKELIQGLLQGPEAGHPQQPAG